MGEATPWSLAQINGAAQWSVENSPSVPNYLANDWSDVDLWKPSGMGNSPEELASALKMYDNWMKIVQSYNDSLQKKQFVSPLNLREEMFGAPANSYQLAQNNLRNIANDADFSEDVLSGAMDSNFDRVFNKTLGEEGGYEDRPNKIDTATNMGFQQVTLERFKKKHPELAQGFPEHVKDLTREQGRIIALKDFYEPYRIGEIKSPALQETMFDSFFNHSPKAPALWAQRAINQNTKRHVKEDGIFGSETINTINQLSEDEMIKVNNAIVKQRLEDHEREKETNPNPYYKGYTVGLPNRFKRFKIE